MRLKKLFFWDVRFQGRDGFYFLYGFLTVLYMILLLSLPVTWKTTAASILIFSDPAAMGLFFMGAIVLLEKSQRVTSYFAISPLRAFEYVLSKVLSLSLIGVIVAAVLAVTTGCAAFFQVLTGTVLSSVLFTLLGMIIATKIRSLNQFLIATVPIELITFVPAILHLAGITPAIFGIYPANVCMDLVAGRAFSELGLILTAALIVLLFWAADRCVWKMWQEQGGVKL